MSVPNSALILVTVIPSMRDLEIARLLGWYRIPLQRAPKVIGVDYLAFYQTAAFAERKWRIEYVAPVKGYELVTRAELLREEREHPRARQEYYKISLGGLEALPDAIPAGNWKRVTFFYTTGEFLLQAASLNDLVMHAEERKTLWRALRERGSAIQRNEDLPDLNLDEATLAALLGFGTAGYQKDKAGTHA